MSNQLKEEKVEVEAEGENDSLGVVTAALMDPYVKIESEEEDIDMSQGYDEEK